MADQTIYEAAKIYRARLLRRERRVVAQMLRDWRAIEKRLLAEATKVGERIRAAAESGIAPEPVWLYQQGRAEELLLQARREMAALSARYAPYLIDEARGAALDGAKLAGVQLSVSTAFSTRLSREAIEFIAASTRTGPLADLLAGIDIEGALRRGLVTGVARGANPREIAREVSRAVNATKQRTLTIARTEVARAQRQAQLSALQSAGVTQWVWSSAQDASTCAACWAMDGQVFDIDFVMDDHPNGRCSLLPVSEGMNLADRPDKEAAWGRLSEGDKLGVLGPGRYDLVASGEVGLDDLARDPADIPLTQWGRSAQVAPIASLTA